MANTYTDDKGRRRWHRNDEIANVVKQLGDYLIIGGYPEQHAKRYAQLAHTISRWPDSIDQLCKQGELNSIPGVGGVITEYLTEIIKTGTTAKFDDSQYGTPPPRSVLEMTAVSGLGPKTAALLLHEHGIASLNDLCDALHHGKLQSIKGIGPALCKRIARQCELKQQ